MISTNSGDFMAKTVPAIQTDRLFLRGIEAADAETIVRWRSAPDVYQYLKSPHAITLEEHLHWFHNQYLFNENRCDWMCMEKETGNQVGVFGLIRSGKKAEVNYLLAPEAQHKGYATEVIKRLIAFSVDVWGTSQAIAEIHKDNAPSVCLAHRVGFRLISEKSGFLVFGTEV